jgi:hypothetical protein
MRLIQFGDFRSTANVDLRFKIECDALTDDEIEDIARIASPRLGPFGAVVGIPRGGIRLAEHFSEFIDPNSKEILVVDDVWTTGKSMIDYVSGFNEFAQWKGFVIFKRGGYTLPYNIIPMFTLCSAFGP